MIFNHGTFKNSIQYKIYDENGLFMNYTELDLWRADWAEIQSPSIVL